jgi:uncharacterized protein (TIGR02598 family)
LNSCLEYAHEPPSKARAPLVLRGSGARLSSGFSLVEVVLAVGVIAFAFVAILGLIPAGLQQYRISIDNSVCTQIAQRVIMDCQQADFNTLTDSAHTGGTVNYIRTPTLADTASAASGSPGPCMRYFDESGNEIKPVGRDPTSNELTAVVYYVNTRVAITTNMPKPSSSSPVSSADLATVTVEIAFNPGHKSIPVQSQAAIVSNTYLIDRTQQTTLSMPIRTYCAQVGRNF